MAIVAAASRFQGAGDETKMVGWAVGAIGSGQPIYFTATGGAAPRSNADVSVAQTGDNGMIHGIATSTSADTKEVSFIRIRPGDLIKINYNGGTPVQGTAYGIDQYGCLDYANTTQKNLTCVSVVDAAVCIAMVNQLTLTAA